jgi:dTDP-4-amino-4,6-dideoxygalactose transaminase
MIPISRPIVGREERQAVDQVLASGMLASGREVRAFEEEFADYVGAAHGVAVGSGTAALHVGLLAAGVGVGDEVIVPSFTFAATANSVRLIGAHPVFVDVEDRTYSTTAELVEPALTDRTVAVMPVHLFGHPAPMDELLALASAADVMVIEDAAQAHGATLDGRPVGALGALGAFSFYPTKNMTTGEGGMITTNDPAIARRAALLRNQGMEQRYLHEMVGLNERMTEIEGAIGRVQLRHLPEWTEQRQANAAFYNEHLDDSVTKPVVQAGATHVYHQYTIRVPDRSTLEDAFQEEGIGYGIYYPRPTHLQPPYAEGAPSLPVTERLAEEVISIPVRPDLTEEERSRVVEVINEVVTS